MADNYDDHGAQDASRVAHINRLEEENEILRARLEDVRMEMSIRSAQHNLARMGFPNDMAIAFALLNGGVINMSYSDKGHYVTISRKDGAVLWQSAYDEEG